MTAKLAVVFGGSGFVGRNVVRELAKRGWRVRVAVRRPHQAQFLRPMGAVGQIQLMQANVRHRPSVAEALKGADAVINLVGILHQEGGQSFARVQAMGAETIAALAADAGIENFVHVSSIGAARGSDSLYAKTKGIGEEAVRRYLPAATILRPSIIFGAEDEFFNKFATVFGLIPPFVPLPLLIGGGKTRFQPVYVDDVADAVCAALSRADAAGKVFELGGPRIYTFRDLLELIMSETGKKRILWPVPFSIAPALGFFGEALGALPFLDPPITRDQIRLLKRDNVVSDGALTLADLGVAPETLEAVLPSYMVRFRRYGQFTPKQA